ncbi:MAG: ABC transporter permease [Coriobacteriales bacterium]|jgi:ABC-2 type transport system permease protein|nr:ABC transporter permease [Coriobacteriales bacterium]
MIDIIRSEFYKLAKARSFFICLALCAALAVFLGFAIQMGVAARGSSDGAAILSDISALVLLEQTLGQPFLPTLFAIFVSLFVSSEFHNGTMKNCVSKGFNRIQIYLAKLLVCGLAVLAMYAAHVIAAFIVGSVLWGFDPYGLATVSNVATLLLSEGLLFLAYAALFVLVSLWLRSVGASIAVNICASYLFPTLLMAANYIVGDTVTLSDYWISGNISALATLSPEPGAVVQGIVVGLAYLIGSTVLGSLLFRRQDIR